MKNPMIAIFAGLFLASCAPSTPLARIQQQPDKFDALSAKNKESFASLQFSKSLQSSP